MEAMKEEVTFSHFSHHHPLIPAPNSSPARKIACSGCNLSIMPGKDYYHCKICNFSLHKVCYNMPRKTRHPGHPNHFLNLLVMPSSVKLGNFKCKACGQNVTGFYYNCGQCGFCYHILCSALPLSISINSHSHSLKLEFSLPYDFECDLCYKPCCYSGWLYRCRLCEFDAHLDCAIINQRTQPLEHQSITNPLPIPLTRQIIYSSASITEPSRKIIDYGSESNELMQLVSQGIARGIKQEPTNVAVTGWDEKLYSPREKLNLRNGVIEFSGLIQTKQDMAAISPIPGGNSEHVDQSSTLSSYQFSDSYFSIDFAKSYSSYDQPNQENINDARDLGKANVVQDVEEKIIYENNSVLDRIEENLEPAAAKQELRKPSFGFHYGPEYKINEAFLNGGGSDTCEKQRKHKVKKNETRDKSSINNQSSLSDPESSKGSCWWKLLQYCCYYAKYEREIILPQA